MQNKREKAFFGAMEFFASLLYVASPTMVFAVIAGLSYLKYPQFSPLLSFVLILIGFILGCAWAWRIYSGNGAVNTVTGLHGTPELDDMPDKTPREPKESE